MTYLIIPLVLLCLAAILIAVLTEVERRRPVRWEEPSEFERYQARARERRARAEWRRRQQTIERERDLL